MPSSFHDSSSCLYCLYFLCILWKWIFCQLRFWKYTTWNSLYSVKNYFFHYFLIKLDISFLVNLSIGLGNVQSFLPFLKPFSNCIFCLSSHFYFFLFSIPLAFSSPYTFFCLLFIGYFFFHLFLLLAKA